MGFQGSYLKEGVAMVRREFIKSQVLKAYRALPKIIFPMDAKRVIEMIPNCEYCSYQDFAQANGFSVEDVSDTCGSKFGCTIFNRKSNRYLILCNQSTDGNNNYGRQRWTCSHELGHIMCDHHNLSASDNFAYQGKARLCNEDCEAEADLFAAIFLAPFPLFEYIGIKSPLDVQNVLGLSCEASVYTFEKYIRWRQNRIKKAWENDMIRTYIYKTQR